MLQPHRHVLLQEDVVVLRWAARPQAHCRVKNQRQRHEEELAERLRRALRGASVLRSSGDDEGYGVLDGGNGGTLPSGPGRFTRSFSSLPARKRMPRLAFTGIGSPVFGLRPW